MSASTRITLAAAAAVLVAPATAAAAAPSVESMIVGRTAVLAPAAQARAAGATVSAGSRRCRVGEGTPLAVLAAVRKSGGPALRIRDFGTCSSRPRDAGGLFVNRIGADANRGQDGWVYKVDGRAGTTPAADPTGPFGTGRRLQSGQRVLWFWCDMGASSCQRTLAVQVPRAVAPTGALTVRVRGLDDRGRAVVVAGATVTAAGRTAISDAQGRVTLPGSWSGTVSVQAQKAGLAPSFPEEVLTG